MSRSSNYMVQWQNCNTDTGYALSKKNLKKNLELHIGWPITHWLATLLVGKYVISFHSLAVLCLLFIHLIRINFCVEKFFCALEWEIWKFLRGQIIAYLGYWIFSRGFNFPQPNQMYLKTLKMIEIGGIWDENRNFLFWIFLCGFIFAHDLSAHNYFSFFARICAKFYPGEHFTNEGFCV